MRVYESVYDSIQKCCLSGPIANTTHIQHHPPYKHTHIKQHTHVCEDPVRQVRDESDAARAPLDRKANRGLVTECRVQRDEGHIDQCHRHVDEQRAVDDDEALSQRARAGDCVALGQDAERVVKV